VRELTNAEAPHSSPLQTIKAPITSPSIAHSHIICGMDGVGKTTVAQSVYALPQIRRSFYDGILWMDLSSQGKLSFHHLIQIYNKILSQLEQTCSSPDEFSNCDFDKIVYIPSQQELDEKQNIEVAMMEARAIMSRFVAHKKCLIFVDGLFSIQDVKFFQFQFSSMDVDNGVNHCRLIVTTNQDPNMDPTYNTNETVLWMLNPLNDDEAQTMFQAELGECAKDTQLVTHLGTAYRECHGIPMSLRAFGRMLSFQHKMGKKNSRPTTDKVLDCIRSLARGENTTHRHMSILLKYTLAHITNDDLARACFSSFTAVFTHKDDCLRPWIHRKVVLWLFSQVIVIKQKKESKKAAKAKIQRLAVKILDSFTQVGILNLHQEHPEEKNPGTHYQIYSHVYQQCGEDLVKYAKTKCQLHLTLVSGYMDAFKQGKKRRIDHNVDYYMIRNLPFHLLEARAYDMVPSILQDVEFITRRIHFLGIQNGAKKHVEDAERLLYSVSSTQENGTINHHPQTLLGSYMAFSRLIENQGKKEEISTSILQSRYRAMYAFSYSLFLAGRIGEGFYMLNKTKPFDKKSCELFLEMDTSNMRNYQNIHQLDTVGIARAQIRIGSIFMRLERGQESINLLERGLVNLREAIGDKSLEVARAQVYIGELYLKVSLYSSAIEKFKPSLSVLMYEIGEDSEELLDALFCTGQAFLGNGDYDIALSILQGVLVKMNAESMTSTDVLITLGKTLIMKNDGPNAISALQEARKGYCTAQQLEAIDVLLEEAEAIHELGTIQVDFDKENESCLYGDPDTNLHPGQHKNAIRHSFDSTISDFTRFTFGQDYMF
jgi:tetratricopeptide (TPR) repeat protein